MQPPQITISAILAGEDPSITIYEVELTGQAGIWRETFGTGGLTEAFLRGIRAAYGINALYITTPDLPRGQ